MSRKWSFLDGNCVAYTQIFRQKQAKLYASVKDTMVLLSKPCKCQRFADE